MSKETEPLEAQEDGALPFIQTKEYRRFAEFCDACRTYRYIGLCYGPPGVGKTLSARHYTQWDLIQAQLHERFYSFTRDPQAEMLIANGFLSDVTRRPTEIITCRSVLFTPLVASTPRQIENEVRALRIALSYLVEDAEKLQAGQRGRRENLPDRTELLIVDETDRLKTAGLEQMHIKIGTYDLLPFCNLDGQMARRGSEIHFAPYHIENETDCQAFRNAFSSLLKQIPLGVDHDTLMQRWWYFFEGSIGCIGILKQWLVLALYRALREESSELTRAHLEQSVLPDAKWARMRADARSGEAEFQYADGQNSYLSNLASMPTFVPKQPDSDTTPRSQPSPEDATVDQKTRNPKSHVGEPSPRRDQVRTAQPEGEATHCSFSGPIKLEAARWLEATVQEVQCPTCGSVSKAKVKGQSVMIASHKPRTARAVRNVTRWTEQGTEWILVQKKG